MPAPHRKTMKHPISASQTPRQNVKKAFTLIELLVVIAIIAILAAILFPVFARARENARRASCQSNLKQIGLGALQYSQDYDEQTVPLRWSYGGTLRNGSHEVPFQVLMQPYVKSTQLFKCPSNTSNANMENTPEAGTLSTQAIPALLHRQLWKGGKRRRPESWNRDRKTTDG